MGHHLYKSTWIPAKAEHLHALMPATNELEKYGVVVQTDDSKVVGHFSLGKSGKLGKVIFHCLKQVSTMSEWFWLPESLKPRWREREKSALFVRVHCWGKIHQSVKVHITEIDIACKYKD